MSVKNRYGCDDMMDCEKNVNDNEIDDTKIKIINTCSPYDLFKKFYYDTNKNKLLEITTTKISSNSTARDRQRDAFFEIHKLKDATHFIDKNETNDQFLTRLAKYHLSRMGCEWCTKEDNCVIDHKHIVSSIYNDKHLGTYRGPLCESCNKIENVCKKKQSISEKKTYLKAHSYGPETIEYILLKWYS